MPGTLKKIQFGIIQFEKYILRSLHTVVAMKTVVEFYFVADL